MRRFPTALEVERVAEALERRPAQASELAASLGIASRHASGALKSLGFQRRAVFYSGQGWTARRRLS